jgi:hypothetical protein
MPRVMNLGGFQIVLIAEDDEPAWLPDRHGRPRGPD